MIVTSMVLGGVGVAVAAGAQLGAESFVPGTDEVVTYSAGPLATGECWLPLDDRWHAGVSVTYSYLFYPATPKFPWMNENRMTHVHRPYALAFASYLFGEGSGRHGPRLGIGVHRHIDVDKSVARFGPIAALGWYAVPVGGVFWGADVHAGLKSGPGGGFEGGFFDLSAQVGWLFSLK